jgi:hypothetical protein
MLKRVRALAVALAAVVAVTAGAHAATASRHVASPFKTFEFEYTSKKPGTATGFSYEFALRIPADGSQPPVVDQLNVVLAPGTKVDLGAIPACTADDTTIAAQGPAVCPARSRLAKGTAGVWTGPGPLLHLDVDVFSTGHGVVVVLEGDGTVITVIRGTIRGTRLRVTVPPVNLGPGVQAAIVHFDLPLAGGSARRPVFTTPRSCPRAGWRIDYRPRFAELGRVRLAYVTHCRPG